MGGGWYWWAFPVHSNPRSSCSRRSEEICYSPHVPRTYRVRHRVFVCRAAWDVYPEVTEAFEELMHMADPISDRTLEVIERFVLLMYSRTSDLSRVNDARKQLFGQKSRSLENIPPTQAAMEQHLKRARYQCNCWNMCLSPDPQLPDPSDWGWTKVSTEWQPFWTVLPEASKSCYELIHCGCKKGCHGRCKCVKAMLKCMCMFG